MAQADSEGQTKRDPSQKDVNADNAGDVGSDNDVQVKTRTLITNVDGNEIVSDDDDDDDESNVDISERLDEFSQANNKPNDSAAMSGARNGQRPTFVHSYSISTSSWRSWASRVAATANIDLVMRNISLLHMLCSLLLIFMGILGMITKSYMSYLAITIWSPVFFFIPTSFTGLLTSKRLRNISLIRRLFVLSTLSTLLSLVLFIAFAFFIFRDGQLNSDCQPSPTVLSSRCRLSVYRVLINAVIVFLYVIELIASLSSLAVSCIIKPGCAKKSSDTEQLISRTSMSYKRLAAAEETVDYFEDRGEDPTLVNNNSHGGMNTRSVSAPALVSYSTTQPYHD